MKLFTLDYKIGDYIFNIESHTEEERYFSGFRYRSDGDYSDEIKQLKFNLARDDNGNFYTNKKYEAIDFFNSPTLINYSEKPNELNFYVVSPRLKGLLGQLELPQHCYYPIELDIDGKRALESYFILQINLDENQFLDYKASTFYHRERIDRGVYNIVNYEQGEIPSYKALQFIEEELENYPYPKSMVLNKTLDWLYYKPYSLISEKARQLFIQHNVIGMEITPMYEKEYKRNFFGYVIEYGGVEIIMDGQSSLEGIDESTFPRAEKDE